MNVTNVLRMAFAELPPVDEEARDGEQALAASVHFTHAADVMNRAIAGIPNTKATLGAAHRQAYEQGLRSSLEDALRGNELVTAESSIVTSLSALDLVTRSASLRWVAPTGHDAHDAVANLRRAANVLLITAADEAGGRLEEAELPANRSTAIESTLRRAEAQITRELDADGDANFGRSTTMLQQATVRSDGGLEAYMDEISNDARSRAGLSAERPDEDDGW